MAEVRCPYCETVADVWLEPDRARGVPTERVRCPRCVRDLVMTGRGPRWLKDGRHCAKCRRVLWRTTTHGRYGHTVYLWPDPSHVTAQFFVFNAEPAMQPYCPPCAPKIDEDAPNQVEVDGAPVTVGPCVGFVGASARYQANYTERAGRFWTAWLRDEVGCADELADALMAKWSNDVETALGGRPQESVTDA